MISYSNSTQWLAHTNNPKTKANAKFTRAIFEVNCTLQFPWDTYKTPEYVEEISRTR